MKWALVRIQLMMSRWLNPHIDAYAKRFNVSRSEFVRYCVMHYIATKPLKSFHKLTKTSIKNGQTYLVNDYEWKHRRSIECR